MSSYGNGSVKINNFSSSLSTMPNYYGYAHVETETYISTWIISIILFIIYVFGLILESLCAIMFFYHFIKKTKYFSTGFFNILTLGYVTDMISMLVLILTTMSTSKFAGIGILFFWYSTLLLGPWNTLMALNRFTAVCFWKKHEKFWKGILLKAAIFAMFFYPLIVNIHLIFQNSYCILHSLEYKCTVTTRETQLINMISNGIHVIFGAILGITTAFSSRFNLVTVTVERKKFESFLIIQSIASIIIFALNLYYFLTKPRIFVSYNYSFHNMIEVLSNCYYVYFRISSTLLLFILSKMVRKSFIDFYGLHFFLSTKRNKRSAISAVKMTVSSTTSKASSVIKIT